MKCLRIYATADGESHFGEVELPTTKISLHPDALPFDVTASYPASRVRLTHIPAGMREVAWHRVLEPVLTVRLDGSGEYETSDGEVRHVTAGNFVLVEDTHGKGHLSRHPHRRKPSSGSRCRTASICTKPGRSLRLPVAAGGPEYLAGEIVTTAAPLKLVLNRKLHTLVLNRDPAPRCHGMFLDWSLGV